jgi:HEAT repeat protein
MAQPSPTAEDPRTPADVVSLLVELGRVLRARRFYADGHPALADTFRHALGAVQGELRRHGPLELELADGRFRLAGAELAAPALAELARELAARGIGRLALEPELDAEALAGLNQVLRLDRAELERAGGVARALRERAGETIRVWEAARGGTEPSEPHPLGEAEREEELEFEPSSFLDGDPAAAEPTPELGPFEAEPTPFAALLRELEECEGNAEYARVADRVEELARAAAGAGRREEAWQAVLAAHLQAGDDRKRNAHHRQIADTLLHRLLREEILRDAIERACSPDASAGVQAAQVLVHAGESIVPALLEVAASARDATRRERLHAVILALGDAAAQPLLECLSSPDRRRARSAVRLLGDLQHPRSVEWLEELVASSDPGLRQEAVQALARIGGPEGSAALERVLASPAREVRVLALRALGEGGRREAVAPLARVLRAALEASDAELGREAIRALGRLGRPEAAPELARLLAQRRLFGRARLREQQLAAVAALARLPGEAATRALSEACRRGDRKVRQAARTALERRPGPGRRRAAEAPSGG